MTLSSSRHPHRNPERRYLPAAGIALLVVLSFAPGASALAPQPQQLVSDVIARVLARLDETPVSEDADAEAAVLALFEQELSPYLAFDTITRWVAGKSWQDLNGEQQGELREVIRGHIVHVYATLLARGRTVDIRIDDAAVVKSKSAQVGATLATPDGRDFALEFRLLRTGEDWKLFDLTVDGLSFARSLRAELSPVLSGGGIRALRRYLSEHQR